MLAKAALSAVFALLVGAIVPSQSLPELAVRGLDPVALCGGEELAGKDELAVDLRRYRYRFATEANLATFNADPERYCIQLGGGCGRMGPLSGTGDPSRFVVHDGRIYIFASEGCRKGFLADPARHLEVPDPVATGTAEEAAAAAQLLDRAVEAIGEQALARLRSLSLRAEHEQEYEGKQVATGESLLLVAPAGIRTESWWGEMLTAHVGNAAAGFTWQRRDAKSEPTTWDFDRSQVLAHCKIALREPVALLAARGREGYVAFKKGERVIGDRKVQDVAISFFGVTTTLAIDVENGRVLGAAYRGRLGSTPVGDVELTFDDFRDVGGLSLPFVRNATYQGKAAATRTWTKAELNGQVDRKLFSRR